MEVLNGDIMSLVRGCLGNQQKQKNMYPFNWYFPRKCDTNMLCIEARLHPADFLIDTWITCVVKCFMYGGTIKVHDAVQCLQTLICENYIKIFLEIEWNDLKCFHICQLDGIINRGFQQILTKIFTLFHLNFWIPKIFWQFIGPPLVLIRIPK